MNEQYTRVGSIVGTYGTEGEIILKHNLGKKSAFPGVESFFIEVSRGSYIPYFPLQIRSKNNEEVIIRLDAVASKEAAQLLLKKQVWLPESQVSRLAAKNAPVSLLGYTVLNNKEALGIVEEVIEQPQQILLRIDINKKEVLIPLNESTLEKINHPRKQVFVSLPEGLLEIYL